MRTPLSRDALWRTACLACAALAVAWAWCVAISRRGFDYDEIYHAHAAWLIRQGDIPFHDFFVCHPPFAWYAVAPLWDWFGNSPAAMIPFRYTAAAGVVLWMVALAENFRLGRDIPRAWMYLFLLAALGQLDLVEFALEFRPDAWWYALSFGALLLFRFNLPSGTFWRPLVFGFLSGWSVMATPKCVLLPVMFVVFDFALAPNRRRWLRSVPGLLCGIALAAASGGACLRAWGIDLRLAWELGLRYQAVFMSGTGFRYGLLHSLLDRPLMTALAVGSILAWGLTLRRRGLRPNAFELAVLAFLLLQPGVVQRPYKQYYAPWYLMAAGFSPYLCLFWNREYRFPSEKIFATGAVLVVLLSLSTMRKFATLEGVAPMLAYYRQIVAATDESAAIVAPPPFHPVVRRDAFYAWNRTTDPAGFTTESIVEQLHLADVGERFRPDGYRQQLAARPPAIIILPPPGWTLYEPHQSEVLMEFLRDHRTKYALLQEATLMPTLRRIGGEQP